MSADPRGVVDSGNPTGARRATYDVIEILVFLGRPEEYDAAVKAADDIRDALNLIGKGEQVPLHLMRRLHAKVTDIRGGDGADG